MPLIPETILDDIQSRADIADVIGRYVPLKRAGRHFKALCPFHTERTPSFHVNTDKQIFHCFGCGVGGNIFSFLMHQERLTFPEAARALAEQVGVEIPSHVEGARDRRPEQICAVLEKACRYYERLLAHPQQGRSARAYLKRRGVTERTRETFRLGCAPMTGWEHLTQAATHAKIAPELLEQAGLSLRRSHGVVDRFRQRLVFPLQDVRGRVVGFGGRSLADQEPKYLNSSETAVYSKGRQLFGLYQAKDEIVKAKTAVLVEGYFDCVLLWQAGLKHVVSPMGTALTTEQARLLARYAPRVVLAFDADAAGEAAALRGIDILVEAGFEVQVAQLPAGIDPDEVVQSQGLAAFEALVDQAAGVLEFLMSCAAKRSSLRTAEGKVQAAQFILPTVANVPNAMLRREYVRLLAERLHLDEQAISEELRKVKPRAFQPPVVRRAGASKPLSGAERMLVALLLDQPSRWEAVKDEAFMEAFDDPRLRQIVDVLGSLRTASSQDPTPAQVISRLAEADVAPVVSELVELAQSVPAKDEAFRECLRRLRLDVRKRELTQLEAQIRLAQGVGQEQEMARLLTNFQRVVKGG